MATRLDLVTTVVGWPKNGRDCDNFSTLAAARERERDLSAPADRQRIARDLHDHVIQRLFVTGMDLQGTITRSRSPVVTERLSRSVDDLQTIVDEIRATIFELHSAATHAGDFRQRIQKVVADLTEDRDIITTLRICGPITVVDGDLADHAEAAMVEAISNTVRHSGVSRLMIEVTVADELAIQFVDNGCGIPAANQRRSGLANMQQRAEHVGGNCQITSRAEGGTRVHWTAPLNRS